MTQFEVGEHVTLLASIMPGFRDIRSQFLVGSIWVASIVLVVIPGRDHLRKLLTFKPLIDPWNALPESIRFGILATAVYLLGMAIPSWIAAGMAPIRKKLVKVLIDDPNPLMKGRRNQFRVAVAKRLDAIRNRLFVPSGGSNGLISAAIQNSIPDGADDGVANVLGAPVALAEIELAALRLSKELPEQYQQYDRIKSEGELRTSIAPALAAVGFGVSLYAVNVPIGVAVALVGFCVALTISSQGHALRLEAESLIATAIYLKWTGTPTVDAISADLKQLQVTGNSSVAGQLDCVLGHITAMHNPEVNQWVSSRMRHPSRSGIAMAPGVAAILRKYELRGIHHPLAAEAPPARGGDSSSSAATGAVEG
ncbi:hypothetical protein [Kribbella sp. NPDC003557]|uniref:hypothetical protein n=1 Tax=Kribbella sp. NPDC003557 TaxID=3154449 RepID=UPI0033BC6FAF